MRCYGYDRQSGDRGPKACRKTRSRPRTYRRRKRAEALRQQGAETAFGDLLDLDGVRFAMEGVTGAYFVYPFNPGLIDAAAFFAQAAIEAGVRSIVNMSQKSARRGKEPSRPRSLDHRTGIRLVRSSVNSYTADVLRRMASLSDGRLERKRRRH